MGKPRMSDNEIIKLVKSSGFKIYAIERKNGRVYVKVKCDNLHTRIMRLDSIQASKKCRECTYTYPKEYIASKRLTKEEIISRFADKGFTVLAGRYKNNQSKIKVKCQKDHIFYISIASLSMGHGCNQCHIDTYKVTESHRRERQNKWARENYKPKPNPIPAIKLMDKKYMHGLVTGNNCRFKEKIRFQNLHEKFTEFNYLCAYCDYPHNLEVDHIIPRSRQGRNHIKNIVPCCHSCNLSKKARNVVVWYKERKFYAADKLAKILAPLKQLLNENVPDSHGNRYV